MRTLMTAPGAIAVVMAMLLMACDADGGGSDGDGGTVRGPVEGAEIVYEASTERNNTTVTNVFVIDPETGESRQLTDAQGYDGQPAWTPDRSRIVFISDRGQERNVSDVYTMNADGSDPQRITSTPDQGERSPKYSPDGSRIAMVVRADDEYWLATIAPDGSDEQRLAGPYDFIEFPAWTRDGGRIFFAAITPDSQSVDILSVDPASREVATQISTPSADVCPHFSWDGEHMTYARSPGDPSEEPDIFRREVGSDDTSGEDDERLTDSPARDDYANPSPDDAEFVFLSNRDGNFDLYVMDADGSNVRRLTDTPDLRENVPNW